MKTKETSPKQIYITAVTSGLTMLANKGKHTNNHLKESAIKRRKFTDDEILFIRESVKNKTKTRKELMLEFNLTEQRICDIIKGRIYKHLKI